MAWLTRITSGLTRLQRPARGGRSLRVGKKGDVAVGSSGSERRKRKRGPPVGVSMGAALSEKRFVEGRKTGLVLGSVGLLGWVGQFLFFSSCLLFLFLIQISVLNFNQLFKHSNNSNNSHM